MEKEQEDEMVHRLEKRENDKAEAVKRQETALKLDEEAVQTISTRMQQVVSEAQQAASDTVHSEQTLKNAVQDIKAIAAAEKAKLDQEVDKFKKSAIHLAKQKVEEANKAQAEDFQKKQKIPLQAKK